MKLSYLLAALGAATLTTLAGAQNGSDNCTTPDAIAGQGSFSFDSTLATTGPEGQSEPLCFAFGSNAVDSDVWFNWTADATGIASISTCASLLDTKIAGYPAGGCPVVAGTAIACNDDSCSVQSAIDFACTTGTAYLLQIGSFPGNVGGTGTIDIVIASSATNDDCGGAVAIAGQGTFAFNQLGASGGLEGQNEALCLFFGLSSIANDIWYAWTPSLAGVAVIGTCTASVDTKIAAYASSGCPTPGTSIACNDDSCGLQSEVQFPVSAGSTYTLQIGTFPGSSGGAGNMEITVSPPAGNDSCAFATAIAGQGVFPFDQTGSTTGADGQAETACYFFGGSTIDNDVWYDWTADASGTVAINTCTSFVDTKLAIYPGAGCPVAGSAIGCNEDSCGLQSQVFATVVAGSVYSIQVGTFPGATAGSGNLDISITGSLQADDCATPDVIAGQGTFAYNSTIATTGLEGQAEASCYFFGSAVIDNDVWFSWTADATGQASVSTCLGAALDTKLAVYPGVGCPLDGSALACNDDGCGLQSEVLLNVVTGTSYLLQVGNFPGTAGGAASVDILITGPVEPGTPFCFCDAVIAPCTNPGTAGNGCGNGSDPAGANLTATGNADVGADTLVFSATGLAPSQPGLYFQGINAVNGGIGIVFGDGLRCAGGDVRRLGVAFADPAGSSSTAGFASTISAKGGVSLGDLKHYQLWYRSPVGSPCGALFNLSNGYTIQW
jgi:hypothetical protein